PPSCVMKPKPFASLNHFTVPLLMNVSLPAGRPLGGLHLLLERSAIPTGKIEKSICDQTLSALQLGRTRNMHVERAFVHYYRGGSRQALFDNAPRAAQHLRSLIFGGAWLVVSKLGYLAKGE